MRPSVTSVEASRRRLGVAGRPSQRTSRPAASPRATHSCVPAPDERPVDDPALARGPAAPERRRVPPRPGRAAIQLAGKSSRARKRAIDEHDQAPATRRRRRGGIGCVTCLHECPPWRRRACRRRHTFSGTPRILRPARESTVRRQPERSYLSRRVGKSDLTPRGFGATCRIRLRCERRSADATAPHFRRECRSQGAVLVGVRAPTRRCCCLGRWSPRARGRLASDARCRVRARRFAWSGRRRGRAAPRRRRGIPRAYEGPRAVSRA
jgi:hypothetical protein